MSLDRRRFLVASAAFAASAPLFAQGLPELLPASQGRRVVIVGGGWGGLSAARHLRSLAPELEVVLLEKNAVFRSMPLSNQWLVGRIGDDLIFHDYRAAADAYGYAFIQAEVTAVDRERRRVVTPRGAVGYDWLVLAVGVRYDFSPWYGDDSQAVAHTLANYPCAFLAGDELPALKRKLDGFKGGDLLMTIPPGPYRCPPAPYERALLIGGLMKARGIKGRLVVLDHGAGGFGFPEVFAEHFKDWITYLAQSPVKSVDPFRRVATTEFEDIRFDDAILMPPQQAGDLVWQAGLIGRDESGTPTGWADQHPVSLTAPGDDRVFLIGDLMGRVSPLFGHYTKTGQAASRLGLIAARGIAARARGTSPEKLVPDSTCYVLTQIEPPEMTRVETEYRLRGDVVVQSGRHVRDPQPRGEDVDWAKAMFRELLAWRG